MFQDWEKRILSKPYPVSWAGFESTTYKLQQAGWQFTAEQDLASMSTRFLMRHNGFKLFGASQLVATDYFIDQDDSNYWGRVNFPIQWMTSGVKVTRVIDNFDQFRPVDMQPQYQAHEETNIEDMNLFATPLARTQEIIVDPNSVPKLMDRILELQDPARKAHFAKMVEEARRPGMMIDSIRPRQQFHAQILSLAA